VSSSEGSRRQRLVGDESPFLFAGRLWALTRVKGPTPWRASLIGPKRGPRCTSRSRLHARYGSACRPFSRHHIARGAERRRSSHAAEGHRRGRGARVSAYGERCRPRFQNSQCQHSLNQSLGCPNLWEALGPRVRPVRRGGLRASADPTSSGATTRCVDVRLRMAPFPPHVAAMSDGAARVGDIWMPSCRLCVPSVHRCRRAASVHGLHRSRRSASRASRSSRARAPAAACRPPRDYSSRADPCGRCRARRRIFDLCHVESRTVG